jgi:hypothetical protein
MRDKDLLAALLTYYCGEPQIMLVFSLTIQECEMRQLGLGEDSCIAI